MNECDNCKQEERLGRMEKELEKHGERLHLGDITLSEIKLRLDGIDKNIAVITADIKELKDKPVKRYDSIVSTVMQFIITGILAYVAVKLGLG